MGQFWYFGDGTQVSLIRIIGCSYDSSKTINKCYLRFYIIYYTENYLSIKVHKVIGCELVKQTDLEFKFNHGSCNSFLEPNPKVLLCIQFYEKTFKKFFYIFNFTRKKIQKKIYLKISFLPN